MAHLWVTQGKANTREVKQLTKVTKRDPGSTNPSLAHSQA